MIKWLKEMFLVDAMIGSKKNASNTVVLMTTPEIKTPEDIQAFNKKYADFYGLIAAVNMKYKYDVHSGSEISYFPHRTNRVDVIDGVAIFDAYSVAHNTHANFEKWNNDPASFKFGTYNGQVCLTKFIVNENENWRIAQAKKKLAAQQKRKARAKAAK